MGLEVATNFNDLNPLFPLATDQRSEGDDHLRMLKVCLQTVFPGMAGRFGRVQAKSAAYTLLATDANTILNCSAALTVTGLAVATAGNGYTVAIHANGGDVTFDPAGAELVNGDASVVVRRGYYGIAYTNGTAWFLLALPVAAEPATSGFKNKIIGGDFTTNPWQRGTTLTAPASGAYTADRFLVLYATDGVVDILKTADAPTVAEAGIFTQHCLHADVTTADAAIAAGQYYMLGQRIEGLNAASFGFGQAGTRYVTLSFWHKHTKIGTYCVALSNSANNRSYVAEYAQAAADTWEKAIVTIPVDTTGTWLYDSTLGLRVTFSLAMGSTYQTAAGAWAVGEYYTTANQVNALDNTANNFKIALVQLEAGQVATQFEALSVGTVLQLCQRYLPAFKSTGTVSPLPGAVNTMSSTTSARLELLFPTKVRAAPTSLVVSNGTHFTYQEAGSNLACSAATLTTAVSLDTAVIDLTCAAGTHGRSGFIFFNDAAAYLYLEGCEL